MNIAALISGGVDSSVSLRLLRDAGHDISAFYLKIWLEDELSFLGECPWEEDILYAEKVCRDAGVSFEAVPFQKEYWDRVVSYVIEESKVGRTPNPDVFCNSLIKFGAFYDAFGKDFDKVATGHYARVSWNSSREIFSSPSRLVKAFGDRKNPLNQRQPEGFSRTESSSSDISKVSEKISTKNFGEEIYFLKKSPDPIKDQTYFLSRLTQAQVSKAVFPIGGFQKEEVRALAERYDLPNAKRKDSQGICFLGQVAFDKFLEYHLGTKEGSIVDWKTGKVLGKHRGFWFHTIGQRKGLGLSGGPWYVVSKDVSSNTVFVSNAWRSEEMERDTFSVSGLNWISGMPSSFLLPSERGASESARVRGENSGSRNLSVKLRHGPKEYPCEISLVDEDTLHVKLDGSDRGIAPGQMAVFYDGDTCLGGGMIEI